MGHVGSTIIKIPNEPSPEEYQVITGIRNPTVGLPSHKVFVADHHRFFQGWIKQKNLEILPYIELPKKIKLVDMDVWDSIVTSFEDIYILEEAGIKFNKANHNYQTKKAAILGELGT